MFSCKEGDPSPLLFAVIVSVMVKRKTLLCSLVTIIDLFLQQNVRLSLVKKENKNVVTLCFRFAIQRTIMHRAAKFKDPPNAVDFL